MTEFATVWQFRCKNSAKLSFFHLANKKRAQTIIDKLYSVAIITRKINIATLNVLTLERVWQCGNDKICHSVAVWQFRCKNSAKLSFFHLANKKRAQTIIDKLCCLEKTDLSPKQGGLKQI